MDEVIKVGEYIIVQRQNFKKLYRFNKANSCVSLGRDNINLSGIEKCRYSSIFKMIPKSGKKNRDYDLELAEEALELKNEIEVKVSGVDNRNIIDDGKSQKLSPSEIEVLKSDSSNKASDIVESLISNSNTFHNKTEFSQEKYLRKKEKKYFEYVQILRPNIRNIAEILYRLDPNKIQGVRIDTLSQIMTMSNIYAEGNHLLYDSGSNGLIAAALLSAIGKDGCSKLIHMHPGNMSQKQALLAMNFSGQQMSKCLSVNVYSALRQYYQGCDTNKNETTSNINVLENIFKRKASDDINIKSKIVKIDDGIQSNDDMITSNGDNMAANDDDCTNLINGENIKTINDTGINLENTTEPKKPKWHYDNIAAAALLHDKMDSLVIACKEDPKNLFNELITFVKPGRPFVIYYTVAEPLQNLYLSLKSQSNVAALRLTCNWMRNYQILQDRTHPEVMMNGSSGFLLTGYVLK